MCASHTFKSPKRRRRTGAKWLNWKCLALLVVAALVCISSPGGVVGPDDRASPAASVATVRPPSPSRFAVSAGGAPIRAHFVQLDGFRTDVVGPALMKCYESTQTGIEATARCRIAAAMQSNAVPCTLVPRAAGKMILARGDSAAPPLSPNFNQPVTKWRSEPPGQQAQSPLHAEHMAAGPTRDRPVHGATTRCDAPKSLQRPARPMGDLASQRGAKRAPSEKPLVAALRAVDASPVLATRPRPPSSASIGTNGLCPRSPRRPAARWSRSPRRACCSASCRARGRRSRSRRGLPRERCCVSVGPMPPPTEAP
jgi:hypothetical protein